MNNISSFPNCILFSEYFCAMSMKLNPKKEVFLAPYCDLFLVSSTTSFGQIDVNEENQVHKEFSNALFCLFCCKNKCKLVKNFLLK